MKQLKLLILAHEAQEKMGNLTPTGISYLDGLRQAYKIEFGMKKTPAKIDSKSGTIIIDKKLFKSNKQDGFIDVHEIKHLIKIEFRKLYNGNNWKEAYSTAEKIVKNKYPKQFKNAMNWIARNKRK